MALPTWRRGSTAALTTLALVVTGALTAAPALAADPPAPTRTITSPGNPIIADGSLYTADAAPLVGADGRLYVYTGHDEAAPQQGGFVMHDYEILATDDVESGEWDVYEHAMDPGEVFDWTSGNAAYAGQATIGADGRYYWYAPVETTDTSMANRMAIGVAVSDSPVGPWEDAIGAPLVTWADVFGSSANGQEVIDPHVFTDVDGSVYLYWGSWSVARVTKLKTNMVERDGAISTISGLTSFYEAPWVFERGGTYYMLYDWKQGGSSCTPSNYQACIGYATASSPMGPWTYRGIILSGTSATTVHPSMIEHDGTWYITYHTKDAVGGGHFRRSVAIDQVQWDGTTILPVQQTRRDDPAYRLTTNVALGAQVSASFTEQPPMRTTAVNDGFRATTALLPPDQWGNYRGTTSSNETDWLSYQWQAPVRVDSVGIQFHQDSNWIRPPASWKLEYLDAAGDWQPVPGATYPTTVNTWLTVDFDAITTTALRATFAGRASGAYFNSVAVSEWEVYAVQPTAVAPISVSTTPGVAPELPPAARITVDGEELWAPVSWLAVDPADYATEGTFTVQGRALGYADALVEATVVVDEDATTTPPTDDEAPTVSISVSGTSGKDGWYSSNVTARVRAEDAVDYLTDVSTKVGDGAWTTTSGVRYADATITASGTTTISGKAEDSSGNTSAEVSRTVKIDKVAPVVTATLDADARTVTITATDALSGVDAIEYRFDGAGAWQTATAGTPVAAPDGLPHQLVHRVRDVAGNTVTGTTTIPLDEDAELTGNVAKYATASASFTAGWENVNGLNDGTNDLFEDAAAKYGSQWGTWPQVGEQTARLTWSFDVSVDSVGVWWFRDSPDTANAGMIPPSSWVLQYLDADGTTWREVTLDEGATYGRTGTGFDRVDFEPVTTRALRIVAQSWGSAEGGGSTGIREWQVVAAAGEEPVGVTPTAPTFTEALECVAGVPEAATVVVPDVEGVVYRVDGEVVTGSLEVPADASVTVTAEAAEGYELADGATAQWTHTFTAPDCPVELVEVTPVAPTAVAAVCVDGAPADGSVTVPEVEGVRYTVDGEEVTGDVPATVGTTVSVVARPLPGYVLAGDAQVVTYAFGFPAPDCTPAPEQVEVGTVTVSGSATVGSRLTVTTDGWGPDDVRLAYQWQADGAAIAGATGSSFTLTPAQLGATVTVRVTGYGDGLVGASALSAPVGPVAKGTFTTTQPRIAGSAKVGATVRVVVGSWTPAPTSRTYQWFANGAKVWGATGTTLTVAPALAGKKLTVRVTGSRDGFVTASATSAPVTVAKATFTAPKPRISGTAKVGATLTVALGSWSPAPSKVTYRWFVGGKQVATTAKLRLTTAMAGKAVTVKVTGTRSGYTTATVTSSAVMVKR
ncbi:family 43 glycosylhydrolase [Cellulomonas sp. DKR-3]|uniref:Family 43 glycosylhydrolase n=1 Tax=Cellulomonas fulva TaxID=2835530 RepID=A0ABS5TYE7_9CELL|nr:family 43 glycosylhydrolase [Cellulomonas fulva]MBT0994181.1 family 43 glycosylhydrolase [Cellulomonas fulva]